MPRKHKTSGPAKPAADEHLERVESVSRENARLANETPMTKVQAEEISKRSI
jgi:hypothetical protein